MPNPPDQSFGSNGRAGATAESFDRTLASASFTPTSGTLYLRSVWTRYANMTKLVTALTGTICAGQSHAAYVVCDAFGNVLAESVDQLGVTPWGVANSEAVVSLATPYQTYLSQLTQFLLGFYVTATTPPTILAAPATAANIGGIAFPPIINCTGGTGFTTPPPIGSQLTLASSNNQPWIYALAT